MKITSIFFAIFYIALVGCNQHNSETNSSQNSSNRIDQRVDSLINLMTLEEKIGQLNQYSIGTEMTGPGKKSGRDSIRYTRLLNGGVGSVLNLLGAKETYELQKQVVENSRLRIPLLFSYDVVHGYKTMFPIPLGESASWDLPAIEQSAAIAAKEAASAGIHWTFAPMVDISRDARWGRVMEGAGEDTYLGSQVAVARVKGFQGKDLSFNYTVAACAKHFAGYGFVESGKDYNNVYVGKSMLLNTILPPFKAANEAGVATYMNAFNDIDGVPSTANNYLINNLLKGEWGFDGFVVSDWNSIGELVSHGTASNKKEAAEQAINAGTDMDMEGDAYINHLKELVKTGEIKESAIEESVRRILRIKFQLGLFDNPYKYCDESLEKATLLSDDHLKAARDIARKSIVLLKNKDNLLPLDTSQSIGIIGPLAKDKDSPLGNWRGAAISNSAISFYEGLTNSLTDVTVSYAEGCKLSIGSNNFFQELEIEKSDRSGFEEARKVAEESDIVIMVVGETAYMSGEGRSRSQIGLPGLQLELLKEVYKVNKNIVLVLMNGRPLTLTWEDENIPAIIETWHLGSEAGNAISDVLLGKYNPSGKLPMTFPRSVGQLPIYYNYKNTGRPATSPGQVFYTHHGDINNSPLYPFGYGLSYTKFTYNNLRLSDNRLLRNDSIIISVDVTNAGKWDGEEVVQLYIQDEVGSITRPVKELKDFKKLFFKVGEQKVITFTISAEDLSFYRKDFSYGVEPGNFNVFIGGNSQDVLKESFELIEK
jgi:beta-glucosidase